MLLGNQISSRCLFHETFGLLFISQMSVNYVTATLLKCAFEREPTCGFPFLFYSQCTSPSPPPPTFFLRIAVQFVRRPLRMDSGEKVEPDTPTFSRSAAFQNYFSVP